MTRLLILTIIYLATSHIQMHSQDVESFCERLANKAGSAPDEALDSINYYKAHPDYQTYSVSNKTWLNVQEAYIILRKGRFDEVKKKVKQYLSDAEQWGELSTHNKLANYIGIAYAQTSHIDSAVYYLSLAADYVTDPKSADDKGVVYANMGNLLNLDGQHQRAMEWFTKSYAILKHYEGKDPVEQYDRLLTNLTGTMSNAYQLLDQQDSAKYYAQLAIDIDGGKYNLGGYFTALITMAASAVLEGDTTTAIQKYKRLYEVSDSLEIPKYKHSAGIRLGLLLEDDVQATKYIKEGYEYFKANDQTMDERAALRLISQYEKTGEYQEAYELLSAVTAEKDSANAQSLKEKQEELIVMFETAEKEKVIALQEKELVQKQLTQNRLLGGLALLTIFGLGFFVYYMQNQKINKQRMLTEREENEKRFAQLETMILKSQMNPHFLFNSLNSIRFLFMKDQKEQGLLYITKFAKLLRTSLHLGESALVPLQEEITLTELYVSLEQLRFDDQFSFTSSYPSDDDWKSVAVPPFVVQPLVENAFWHGLSQSSNPVKKLHVSIKKEDDIWLIVVEDNGVGLAHSKESVDKSVGKKKSYGLSLIKERFELINKTGDHSFSLAIEDSTSNDTGAAITIAISPKDKQI